MGFEGGFLSSRGYRDAKRRALSARQVRDRELVKIVREFHAENYGVYGVHKMWHALKRRDIEIGREQTRRIMALAGVKGKRKGKTPVTTRKSRNVDTRPDLVQRNFRAPCNLGIVATPGVEGSVVGCCGSIVT